MQTAKQLYILNTRGLPNRKVTKYVPNDKSLGNNEQHYTVGSTTVPTSDITSYLGNPIIHPIVLKYQELELRLDTVLSEVGMTKNIIKTSLQGVDGTVKEYISDGDYTITIQGSVVAEDNSFPTQEVKKLHQLCLVKDALVVESEFLQLFDIYNLVIEQYSFPEVESYYNLQPFKLECISDTPIELIIYNETLN